MDISTIILDNGFNCQDTDSLSGEITYSNEFYLVKVSDWKERIYIAYKEKFENWDKSLIQTFSISTNDEVVDNLFKMMTLQPLEFKNIKSGSICNDCAFRFNLTWPKGHCATFWQGECSQCHQEAGCCSTGDWNHKGKKVFGMRD